MDVSPGSVRRGRAPTAVLDLAEELAVDLAEALDAIAAVELRDAVEVADCWFHDQPAPDVPGPAADPRGVAVACPPEDEREPEPRGVLYVRLHDGSEPPLDVKTFSEKVAASVTPWQAVGAFFQTYGAATGLAIPVIVGAGIAIVRRMRRHEPKPSGVRQPGVRRPPCRRPAGRAAQPAADRVTADARWFA
jgi:hypothetical protein